jgi:hypothetical protein
MLRIFRLYKKGLEEAFSEVRRSDIRLLDLSSSREYAAGPP